MVGLIKEGYTFAQAKSKADEIKNVWFILYNDWWHIN
jgi:hypothetical protein